MKLKSYFAETVEAAMALASEELGPEAMLVQSKRTTQTRRQPGRYEVVFAVEEPPVRDPAIQKLSSELEQLKTHIESMSGKFGADKLRDPLAERLAFAEVDRDLARVILKKAGVNGAAGARKTLEKIARVDPAMEAASAARKVVAIVGPPGAGKTTALVKLAIRYGLAARRSVHLLSTDVYRVGGSEQLRLYASILGVSFQTAESPLALAQALEEQRRKELVFIDTPGGANGQVPEIGELAAYIAGDREIDVHLVLPASNRACDLARIADRYEIFKPSKLLFTRIDETGRHGPLINESYRTGKPVSFLCGGERIPEDLEPATAARIADLILRPDVKPAVSLEEAQQ